MRLLNSDSLLQIADGNVTRYLKVYHDPNGDDNDITLDVISYSWGRDVSTQGQCTIYLYNIENTPGSTYHKYSPEASGAGFIPIVEGDEIQLIEGIDNGASQDSFYNFFGVVKQAVPQDANGQAILELTILDKMYLLKNMEWDHDHEAPVTTQALTRIYPDTSDDGEFFFGTIYTVTPNKVTYINDSQEEELSDDGYSGRNILYNFTRGTWRFISSYTNSTNTINTNYTVDKWQTGDLITNKQWFSIFNLAHSAIKPNSVYLRIRNVEASVSDDPVYDGFGVEYQSGQIVLSAPINVITYYLYAKYKYYETGLTAESLIETIATTVDVYGNAVFSSSDIQETFENVEGAGETDTMTGAGDVWYTSYNNIQTTLGAGDFTITGGSFVSFDSLTGTLTTSGSPSAVTCTNNYTFKTLQSTGIEIPYYKPSDINTIGRYDAIQQILKNVAPNYRLWVAGNGKLWGSYFTQKSVADATVSITSSNPERFIHYPDEEVYTRVKIFVENLSPTNELGNADFVWSGLERYDLTDVQLNYVGQVDGFLAFRIPFIVSRGYILSDPAPTLKINDADVNKESYEVYLAFGSGDWSITWVNNYQSGLVATIELPDKNIVPDSIKFYFDPVVEDLILSNEYDFIYDVDYVNGIISFYCPSQVIEGITYMKYNVMSYTGVGSGNDFVVDYSSNTIYINPNYIPNIQYNSSNQIIGVNDIITLSFSYVALGVPDGNRIPSELRANRGYMLDGSPSSAAIWSWIEERKTAYEDRPESAILFVASFDEAKSIDSIKISAGNFYTKVAGFSVDKTFPCNYTMTIKYSESAIFTADLFRSIEDDDTTFFVMNCKRRSSLSSSGSVWIDAEEIYYTAFNYLGNGMGQFTGCTRGYNGTYALPHITSKTLADYGRVYGDATFNEIVGELTDLEMNTGKNVEVDRNTLGEDFTVGAIQVIITDAEPVIFEYPNGESFTVYPVSISDFRVESNKYLKADIQLAASASSTTVEDVLNLRTQLGERTYKKTYENTRVLYDLTTLQILGKNLLTEYVKNNTRVQFTEMYHPDWDVGMTLNIVDAPNNINRNYFCERISSDNGKITLDLAYYP